MVKKKDPEKFPLETEVRRKYTTERRCAQILNERTELSTCSEQVGDARQVTKDQTDAGEEITSASPLDATTDTCDEHNQEALQIDGTDGIKHCHDNCRAQEHRERETKVAGRKLFVVSVICLTFIVGEVLGGYFAGSLAVMTDAAHLLVDFVSFIISLLSLWLSSRPATHRLSYGWHRAEILGALLSVFTIWMVTGVLVYLAVERLINDDYTIEGTVMLVTSGCAVMVNIIMALILHQSSHGHSHGGLASHGHGHSNGDLSSHGHGHSNGDLSSHGHGHSNGDLSSHGHGHVHKKGSNQMSNRAQLTLDNVDLKQKGVDRGRKAQQASASVRAAFVHVVGDLLQSISVLVSAIIIFFKPEYKMADPICTFLFSILVLCTTVTIMRDILIVLMEGTPAGVKYSEVRDGLLAVEGVTAVHNLHIWSLTLNQAVLSAHVVIDESVDAQTVLREITQACFSSYNLHSVTIQMERQADLRPGCTLCQDPKK